MNKFTSANPCDFICYKYPNLYCIECKSVSGNTFPITNLTQLDKLKSFLGIEGIRCGVLIWFIDHDKEVYVPIKTFIKLQQEDKKSFNIKTTPQEDYLLIPTIKKKVFLDADYSILLNLEEGW